jgi:hypothetical protein
VADFSSIWEGLAVTTKKTLHDGYSAVKAACADSHRSAKTRAIIQDVCRSTLRFLNADARLVKLNSRVPNKSYISYRTDGAVARPANEALFVPDLATFDKLWKSWQKAQIKKPDLLRLLYTAALAPCLGMELFDKQNKKGPATYFECFIGNLLATQLKREPTRNAGLKIGTAAVRLTMDFLFAPKGDQPGLHVPVKMSTRERVVQAWSHQRLLDSAYGDGRYVGLMILFSETKLDSRNLEVVEICVPDQWLAYQTYLAKMDNIFYFDLPERYAKLATSHPTIMKVGTIEQFII